MLENKTLSDLPIVRRPPRRTAILLMGDTLGLGGTEGQFVELAARLDRSTWDVHVSCLRAEGPLHHRYKKLLNIQADLRITVGGREWFSQPMFPVVELAAAADRWLSRGGDFVFDGGRRVTLPVGA